MRHRNKVAATLVAALATAALAACGGSSDNESTSDTVSGQFELAPGAPAGYESLAGEASLKRADGSTTASLRVSGLEPKTEYVAHLHTEGCDQSDPGGPHFKFDPAGGDEPPNEIHLGFSSDAGGKGSATASSNRDVPAGKAGSIVLHQADAEHMASVAAAEGEAVFVHEGHSHGASPEEEQGHSDVIACAELEGAPAGGGGGASATAPTIVVRGGAPVGGVQELEFNAGERIRFNVESDVADEVHVHGYDLMQNVPKGGEVSFDFPAEIEGIFEVELEGRKEQIAELRVNP